MKSDYIQVKQSGGSSADWTPPVDWPDVSNVASEEVEFVATIGNPVCVFVTLQNQGEYFEVDWGDGTVSEWGVGTGGTPLSHQYTNNGTGVLTSEGLRVWKARVYPRILGGDHITKFVIRTTEFPQSGWGQPEIPVLAIGVGGAAISSFSGMFVSSGSGIYACLTMLRYLVIKSFGTATNATSMCMDLTALRRVVLPPTFESLTVLTSMFQRCTALVTINMPTSFGGVQNVANMFQGCSALPKIVLPSSFAGIGAANGMFQGCGSLESITPITAWPSCNSTANMFDGCYSLMSVTLPDAWENVASVSSMFLTCRSLVKVVMPTAFTIQTSTNSMFESCHSLSEVTITSWGNVQTANNMFFKCSNLMNLTLPMNANVITSATNFLSTCSSLKVLAGLEYLGHPTSLCDLTGVTAGSFIYPLGLTINAKLSKITMNGGSSTFISKINSLRLLNATSTFTGATPQVDVGYTNMGAAALNQLFTDLPIVVGKTIRITGATGAATCTPSIATAKGWTVTN